MDEAGLMQFLDEHAIPYRRYEHPAVFTVAEVDALETKLPGAGNKNLFLHNEKKTRYLLLMTRDHKRVDLRAFGALVGIPKGLRFAPEEKLIELLGVNRGAVTVMGVINDTRRRVELYIDRDLWQAGGIHAHPLVNTATLVLTPAALEQFFALTGHNPVFLDVPGEMIS